MPSDNRSQVRLAPLADTARHTPAGMTLLATLEAPRSGWLARVNATGRLVCWTGAGIASINERKAETALADLLADDDKPDDITPEALADAVRNWRGSTPLRHAARKLGVPARTLEAVEQGRGFRYPRLLMIALEVRK